MLLHPMELELAQERREREIAEAIRARGLARQSSSLRRALGLSIMRIGARLAAEPQPRLARSS